MGNWHSKADAVEERGRFRRLAERITDATEIPATLPTLPSGSGLLDNLGAVDGATLLRHLAPLREARVWLPDTSVPPNATDLRIHRVMASGEGGAVVEFRAQP